MILPHGEVEPWRGHPAHALELVHFGLTAKYQLTTALARLRERGDRAAVGEGSGDFGRRKQPLTPGFAVPSPLGEGCYQLRPHCESATHGARVAGQGKPRPYKRPIAAPASWAAAGAVAG